MPSGKHTPPTESNANLGIEGGGGGGCSKLDPVLFENFLSFDTPTFDIMVEAFYER